MPRSYELGLWGLRAGNSTQAGVDCAICWTQVTDSVVTPCGHVFCWKCLSPWISEHPTCPTCRGEIQHPHDEETETQSIDRAFERVSPSHFPWDDHATHTTYEDLFEHYSPLSPLTSSQPFEPRSSREFGTSWGRRSLFDDFYQGNTIPVQLFPSTLVVGRRAWWAFDDHEGFEERMFNERRREERRLEARRIEDQRRLVDYQRRRNEQRRADVQTRAVDQARRAGEQRRVDEQHRRGEGGFDQMLSRGRMTNEQQRVADERRRFEEQQRLNEQWRADETRWFDEARGLDEERRLDERRRLDEQQRMLRDDMWDRW